ANSYGGLETSINLYLEDKKIGEKRISLPRNGEFLDVKFNVMPENEGEFTYRAFLPATDGELSSSNNARSVCVKVLPSKKSILLIGSKPNWEMTFLLRTLAQDPDIVVKSAFLGKASPASETKMPKTLDELSKNDAVYIIDAINQLDGMNLAPLLLDYVNGGGALGFQFLGNIILNKSSGNTWAKMFPFIYSAGSHVWMEDDFVPEVTVRGLAHSITRPQNETSLKVEDYQRIPPLSGFTMITGNTPGSEILMAHPKMDDVPILSVREVGRGRTMIINGAGFWRWAFVPLGFGKDNDLYRGLVNRSSSWLLAAGEGSDFAVETDKQVYRSGEKVIITARLRDQSNQSLEGAKIATKFTSKDNSSDSMVIVLEDRGDGIYSLELPAFDIGRWVINSVASLNEQSINTANYSFLVEPYSIELENVQLNTIALKAIADATGGKFFLPENIDSLDDYIQTPKLVHKERRERDIWDHPVLLIIFVLLLCAEWILRKKWDLP
ncbi:hypothetical protein KAH81_01555, partial [bacterium]|nr:hypothetical protein [bacterium]